MTITAGRYRIGSAEYDPNSATVVREDGSATELRNQSRRMLNLLVEKRGEVISKDTLLSTLWSDRFVTEDNLVQCISDIRRSLGQENRGVIRTYPKRGYQLVEQDAALAAGQGVTVHRAAGPVAAGVVMLLAGPALLTWHLLRGGQDVLAERALGDRTILVMPFVNEGADEEWERLGQGFAMETAGSLARNADLRIIVPPISDEGEALERSGGARFVLSGSLRPRPQGQMELSARLVEVPSSEIVWAERWAGPEDDYFSLLDLVRDRLSASLTSTFTGAISVSDRLHADQRPTDDLRAYDLYLIGSFLKHDFSKEGFAKARGYLEEAVRLDPGFAKAWVSIYYLNTLESFVTEGARNRADLRDAARGAIRHAVAADPDDPETLLAHSVLSAESGDLEAAAAMLQRAVALAPSNADILALASIAAAKHTDLVEEPLEWSRRATELNPFAPAYYEHAVAFAAFKAGDFETSYELFSKGTAPAANIAIAAAAAIHAGRPDDAKTMKSVYESIVPSDATVDEIASLQTTSSDFFREHLLSGAEAAGLPMAEGQAAVQ